MQYIFVINSTAGVQDALPSIREELKQFEGVYPFQVYETQGRGDATRFVRQWCASHQEPVRFIACGGDGTLNEVVSGAVGYPRGEIACYPCGSGNDFVKYYGGKERFLNLQRLFQAPSRPIDLIRVNDRYCVNICNFGFDSYAAEIMMKVKNKKWIGGKNAYLTGVAAALFRAMRTNCRVTVDGMPFYEGDILLCTAANGRYVGGMFQCSPLSQNDDGLLDICLVKPVSRFTFMRLVSAYCRGEHLENPAFARFIRYCRGKQLEVDTPPNFSFCIDGELLVGSHFSIEIMEKAVLFTVPEDDSL